MTTMERAEDGLADEGGRERLEALEKGLTVLRSFGHEVRSLTVQEAALRFGYPRAAARRVLLTLEQLGYLARSDRAFSLTPKVLELGYAYFASLDLPKLAEPFMRQAVDAVGETCSLGVLDGGDVVLIARVEPVQVMRLDLRIGSRLPAYAHSMGRVLLAGLPKEGLERYLETAPLRAITRFTVHSKAGLRRTVNEVARLGWCVSQSELVDGISGVAVPIRDPAGRTIAAMNLSMILGSRTRETLVDEYLPRLRHAADEISNVLKVARNL